MTAVGERVTLDRAGFSALLDALAKAGFDLVGPAVRDGAIVLDTLRGVEDLPRGVGDEQAPGRYRLRERGDEALFGFASSPHAPRRELFPPRATLVQIRRSAEGLAFEAPPPPARKVALVGARACDLAAIAVQDRVLRDGAHPDPDYAARRAGLFVLAVHCGEPAGTCFCASMDAGPRARGGFDLGATELLDGEHRFLVEVATEAGRAALEGVPSRPATDADVAAAEAVTASAAARMGRRVDAEGLPEALLGALEHPRWQATADRCLGCASCTLSCPTCFCTTVEDTTDLAGDVATRTRRWDSCFTMDYAWVHGGSTRPSLRARYRQWLVHKFATWHEQFGTSGCVGCGRCVTWCPVGIDVTEEVAALRGAPSGSHLGSDHG